MARKPFLAFYDSGVGGLPYVESCRQLLPEARFAFLADSAHFPLGTKGKEEVRRIVLSSVLALERAYDPDVIVVACNTATVVALQELRKALPGTPIVGTVPAIKPAAALGGSAPIAVIATERTVTDPYTLDLVSRFAPGRDVRLVAAPSWVEFVEREWLGSDEEARLRAVRPVLEPVLDAGASSIVLACTHFLYLEEAIAKVACGRATIIDSSAGVARRARDMARQVLAKDAPRSGPTPPRDVFHSTGEAARLSAFAERFGFVEGGVLA